MPTETYGGAYYFDGQWWRYTHNKERVFDATAYVDNNTGEVRMHSADLLIDNMLDTEDVARELNVFPRTVSSYLARNEMPAAQSYKGGSPLWSRPVLDYWKAHRPMRRKAAS